MLPSRVKNLVSAFWVGAMQEVNSLPTLFWKGHDLQWQVPRHHHHEGLEKHQGTTGHRRIPRVVLLQRGGGGHGGGRTLTLLYVH
jgi:hypothetical protein